MKKTLNDFVGNARMTINNLTCTFNMPAAVKAQFDENKKEKAQGLPPHSPVQTWKVDDHHCPDNWMHGSGLASSYFLAIEPEKGMWLDFTGNMSHTHHVAVLISVQGVNPIDNESMVDEAFHLRQYKTECPRHKKSFGADRFCEDCGYKWAPQNYLASTGGTHLWLDGFRTDDGVVRQYYFTENEMKGIAQQVIGGDKKTYSIGVAFYLSREPKPVVVTRGFVESEFAPHGGAMKSFGFTAEKKYLASNSAGGSSAAKRARNLKRTLSPSSEIKCSVSNSGGYPPDTLESMQQFSAGDADLGQMYELESVGGVELESLTKNYDIAAGAKINQTIGADPNGIDFWQPTPAGMIYINYCTREMALNILKKGVKDRTKGGEGALAGLIVGNE